MYDDITNSSNAYDRVVNQDLVHQYLVGHNPLVEFVTATADSVTNDMKFDN